MNGQRKSFLSFIHRLIPFGFYTRWTKESQSFCALYTRTMQCNTPNCLSFPFPLSTLPYPPQNLPIGTNQTNGSRPSVHPSINLSPAYPPSAPAPFPEHDSPLFSPTILLRCPPSHPNSVTSNRNIYTRPKPSSSGWQLLGFAQPMGQMGVEAGRALMSLRGLRGRGRGKGRAGMVRFSVYSVCVGYSAGAASAVVGSGLCIYGRMHGGRERRERREGGKGGQCL